MILNVIRLKEISADMKKLIREMLNKETAFFQHINNSADMSSSFLLWTELTFKLSKDITKD